MNRNVINRCPSTRLLSPLALIVVTGIGLSVASAQTNSCLLFVWSLFGLCLLFVWKNTCQFVKTCPKTFKMQSKPVKCRVVDVVI
jgi:hypothetical protein